MLSGADTKTLKLKINADGFEAGDDGTPIPVATMVHGYEMMTYDTDTKRFLSMPNTHGYEKKALPQRAQWWKEPPKDASPWMFETSTGKWNRLRTGTPAPPSSFGDTLSYLPTRKQAFFAHRSSDVWLYDTVANKWRQVSAKGPKPPFGIDATACYDSKRKRIYIGGGSYPVADEGSNAFWIYDLKTDSWIDPKPKGAPCKGSARYPTKNALMLYDSVNDVVLLIVHSTFDSGKSKPGVYVYDPQSNSWAAEALAIPGKLSGDNKPKNGFYDPAANAVFIHTAGDSQDDGIIWVYRYKGSAKATGSVNFKDPVLYADARLKEDAPTPKARPSEAARQELGLAGRSDILLYCDFEDEEWWPAWGCTKQPVNTGMVEGKAAFGGKGKSLRVTVPRRDHMGTTFSYKFRERQSVGGVLSALPTHLSN